MRSDDMIAQAAKLYSEPYRLKGLCVEREWSQDGETELARYPYTRVRFVPVYDAQAFIYERQMIQTGIKAEVW